MRHLLHMRFFLLTINLPGHLCPPCINVIINHHHLLFLQQNLFEKWKIKGKALIADKLPLKFCIILHALFEHRHILCALHLSMQSSQSSCGIFIQLKSCECKVPMRYLDITSSSTTKMMRHHFIVSPLICQGTPCHLCYCHYLSSSTKPLKNRSKRCVSFMILLLEFLYHSPCIIR